MPPPAASVPPARRRSRESYAAAGRIGGLTRAALAPDRRSITAAARDGRWQRYLDQVPASVTDDAGRMRRAELLRRADMIRLSQRAAAARTRAAAARADARQARRELAAVTDSAR